jgi:biotin transport system ATP-binding protein
MSDVSPERAGGATGADPRALAQTIVFSDVTIDRGGRTVLDRVSIGFEESRVGIVGLNGSGKSTLLRAVIGLVAPTRGSITIDGRDAVGAARAVRRTTGLLFQDPDNQKIGRASCRERVS